MEWVGVGVAFMADGGFPYLHEQPCACSVVTRVMLTDHAAPYQCPHDITYSFKPPLPGRRY